MGSEGTEDTSELTVGLFKTVVKGSKLEQAKLWQLYVRRKDGSGEVSIEEFATPGLSSTGGVTGSKLKIGSDRSTRAWPWEV